MLRHFKFISLLVLVYSVSAFAKTPHTEVVQKQFVVFEKLLNDQMVTPSFREHLHSIGVSRRNSEFWIKFYHEGRREEFHIPTLLAIHTDSDGNYIKHKEWEGSTTKKVHFEGLTPVDYLKIAIGYVMKSGEKLYFKEIRESLQTAEVTPKGDGAVVKFQVESSKLTLLLRIDSSGKVDDYPEIIDL
jgi:hypothetical protein